MLSDLNILGPGGKFLLASFCILSRNKLQQLEMFFPVSKPEKETGKDSHQSDGDARRLPLGCKLQILVSLRVFCMEYYICPGISGIA